MGRSYWFECSRCGYRTAVSGGPDRGHDFYVETIHCLECHKLYDVVTRQRVPVPTKPKGFHLHFHFQKPPPPAPPSFQAALTNLPASNLKHTRWIRFKPVCPVAPIHRIEKWSDPGLCPSCGLAIDKNPLPYRIWD